jgi:hypothetical protein
METDSSFHIQKTTKVKRGSFWSARIVNWKNEELYYYKSESSRRSSQRKRRSLAFR